MEKKYVRVQLYTVRKQKKEEMLNRLNEAPWMAEILRKNFTEDELDEDVAKFLREDSASREEK